MQIIRIPAGVNLANCYLIIDKSGESAVLDPGGCSTDILRALDSDRVESVKYILLTHGHYDHILGATELRRRTGALIGIHPDDARCTSDDAYSLADRLGEDMQEPFEADFFLEEGGTVRIGSTELRVMHTPGHSPGSVCLLCKRERVIFSGDTLFCLTIGRTDLLGGDMGEMEASLGRLMSLEGDWRICPGHNRETTLLHEREHNRYMRRRR